MASMGGMLSIGYSMGRDLPHFLLSRLLYVIGANGMFIPLDQCVAFSHDGNSHMLAPALLLCSPGAPVHYRFCSNQVGKLARFVTCSCS